MRQDPPAEKRSGRLISYRVSLVLALTLLVLATGGLIVSYTYFRTRDVIRALAHDLFGQVSRQTVQRTRAHMMRAVPAAETLRTLLRDGLLAEDTDPLARHLLAVVRANPEFTWVSYGDARGAFTGAYRTPAGGLRVNQSAIRDGKTVLDEHDVDAAGRWTLFRHEADTGYDPRQRGWYRIAAEHRGRAWTSPYVFFEQGVPGITCAVPHYDAENALRGVLTVDFDLNALSDFVSKLELSPHGQVFLFTPDGTVLAHPRVRLVTQSGQRDQGRLVTLDDVTDPVTRAYLRHALARHPKPAEGATPALVTDDFEFELDGERHYASYITFEVDSGLRWVVGAVAPDADFLGVVRRHNVTSLLISLAGVLVALVIAAVLASRIADPLIRMAREMERVGRFELDGDAGLGSRFREIAMMDRALAAMKGGLRSFGCYVPRDLVRAVLASGQDAVLEGHVKTLTVYFSDIAGFTTIAESVKPDVLVDVLGGYLDEMTRIIAEHRGTVDKFLGDGIMAFWGAPQDVEDHAARACEAALRSQQRLEAMKREPGNELIRQLSARIGITTGEVLVGNIGTPERMNYTVMGDQVNLAARLEGLNKAYGTSMMISEDTFRAAQGRVVARAVDVVAVKGKARGVRVYELLALAGDADEATRGIAAHSERALDAYLARDFAAAMEAFRAVLALRPEDKVAGLMLARVEQYAQHPPPEGWTGVHVATEK